MNRETPTVQLQGIAGAVHQGELKCEMSARHNSSACVAAGACLPLGGHSVWAALPPLPPLPQAGAEGTGEPQEALPVTLVVASIDASGLFHDSVMVSLYSCFLYVRGGADSASHCATIARLDARLKHLQPPST